MLIWNNSFKKNQFCREPTVPLRPLPLQLLTQIVNTIFYVTGSFKIQTNVRALRKYGTKLMGFSILYFLFETQYMI